MIVQLFNWKFQEIISIIPELSLHGVRYVHVSPPTLSIERKEWWGRYQPLHYFIVDGPLGDRQIFQEMCSLGRDYGIGVIADCVLNHMADPNSGPLVFGDESSLRKHPRWESFSSQYASLPIKRKMMFREEHFFTHSEHTITNYTDNNQVLYGNLGTLPDLDIHHPYVRFIHEEYLEFLIELGVCGIRVDAAKHLPPDYIQHITKTFLDSFHRSIKSNVVPQPIILCEIIALDIETMKPYVDAILKLKPEDMKSVLFYNFAQLNRMKKLVDGDIDFNHYFKNYSEMEKLIGMENTLTFACNHDIPYNDCFKFLEIESSTNLHNIELMNIVFGRQDVGYYFIDQPNPSSRYDSISHTTYSYDKRSNDMFKLFALKKRLEHLPSLQKLWSDGKNFFVGVRTMDGWNYIKNCAIVYINTTPYTYKVHSRWPSKTIFSKLPNGTYRDSFLNQQLTIQDGKLKEHLRLQPHSVNVFESTNSSLSASSKVRNILSDLQNQMEDGIEYIESIDSSLSSHSTQSIKDKNELSKNISRLTKNIQFLEKELSI
jgi:hypothetical protein